MDSHRDPATASTRSLVQDPVCGMDVDPVTTEHHAELDGHTYHFCSAGCRSTFAANPAAFVGDTDDHVGAEHDHAPAAHHHHGAPAGQPTHSPGDAVEWTCPMHPEIRRPGPGSCPICGMALEPVTVTADSGPNPELADMTRRFVVAVVLSIPVLVLSMGRDLVPALEDAISTTAANWAQLVLATPVVLWAGWPFFQRGWTSVRTMRLNMFTLIAMAPASPGCSAS